MTSLKLIMKGTVTGIDQNRLSISKFHLEIKIKKAIFITPGNIHMQTIHRPEPVGLGAGCRQIIEIMRPLFTSVEP